ncbi:MAG: hydroxymethylbilane synthase [Clostridia bacterium]
MLIKIGSRKSPMAVRQTEIVAEKLKKAFPEDEFEIVKMSAEGDRNQHKPLNSFAGKGVFVKVLEAALLSGEIDMAVHSAKDMPTELTSGLRIGAVLKRDYPQDVLVSRSSSLPHKPIIGTGSLRREYQLRELFPEAAITPIRGNVNTRIEKLKSGECDAIMLAAAGIYRMNIHEDKELYFLHFDPTVFIPAAGQGILAVETAGNRMDVYLEAVNDKTAEHILTLEREFLSAVGGGCHEPAGAYAWEENSGFVMRTLLYKNGGKAVLERRGDWETPLGEIMAEESLGILRGQN